ncbi:MAG TPA: hypothetical protein VGO58_11420 [Chitinophagaceae bacterium]|jgi:hypothetical protein|nr:hypothetical protein [Chitinophagaceae bacterium]
MKRRVRKIANFFAFNFLFFALYLNFIHKDRTVVTDGETTLVKAEAFSGTVLVDNPEQYMQKKKDAAATTAAQSSSVKTTQGEGTALKLSIN